MKKALIISYFFPPSNFVGGERIDYWAKNLKKHGVYPIIVTRQWEKGQTDLEKKSNSSDVRVDTFEDYEVHRLPMDKNIIDRLKNIIPITFVRKALTFLELILCNFSIYFGLGNNFYKYSCSLLSSDWSIAYILASGRPFTSFHIGHKLKNQFPRIKWIPDYRDEWSTHQNPEGNSFLWKTIRKIEAKSELKWTSNCDYFISVSKTWVDSISSFIKKPGKEIRNGFNDFPSPKILNSNSDTFHLGYIGSLYNSQNIELVISSLYEVQKIKPIKLSFIGINSNPGQIERIKGLTSGLENVQIKKRMSKNELSKEMQRFDLLILTSFKNVKGWYPVKLFHYFETGIPFILAPSDGDVMEKFCEETNSGYIANDIEGCKEIILNQILNKEKGQISQKKIDFEKSKYYSREYQTKLLADFLDELH